MAGFSNLSLAELLALPLPKAPADFATFWKSSFQEASAIDLRIETRPVPSANPALTIHEIEFNSLDGVRIGGWLTTPVDSEDLQRGVVVGHGYGGRSAPMERIPGPPAVAIHPCARGFDRSKHVSIPGSAAWHVLHGIEHRDTYSHRGCAADLWCAASALLHIHPSAENALDFYGGSFGGGIGALALPWDDRFRKAFFDVPSFGNHPLRLQIPCAGSGEAIRMVHRRKPGIAEVLRYFDSASAAEYLRIPIFVAAALTDPSVPPAGQFSVYNAIRSAKELFVRRTGHPGDPAEDEEIFTRLNDWFSHP